MPVGGLPTPSQGEKFIDPTSRYFMTKFPSFFNQSITNSRQSNDDFNHFKEIANPPSGFDNFNIIANPPSGFEILICDVIVNIADKAINKFADKVSETIQNTDMHFSFGRTLNEVEDSFKGEFTLTPKGKKVRTIEVKSKRKPKKEKMKVHEKVVSDETENLTKSQSDLESYENPIKSQSNFEEKKESRIEDID